MHDKTGIPLYNKIRIRFKVFFKRDKVFLCSIYLWYNLNFDYLNLLFSPITC